MTVAWMHFLTLLLLQRLMGSIVRRMQVALQWDVATSLYHHSKLKLQKVSWGQLNIWTKFPRSSLRKLNCDSERQRTKTVSYLNYDCSLFVGITQPLDYKE